MRLAESVGWTDPGDLHVDANYLDAAIAIGRFDEAASHLVVVEERARRIGRDSVLVECRRIRIALESTAGSLDVALAAVPEMFAAYDAGPCQPLERGRAYLLAGRVLRRSKHKSRAHTAVSTALDIFVGLGCPPYAEQAHAELARVGLRPRSSPDLAGSELVVATLAAEGLRNKEIALQAFVSVKTVEAVLGRCHRTWASGPARNSPRRRRAGSTDRGIAPG